jgi:hypothetical protein
MKHLLLTASTLALGLGLATPLLAESDCVRDASGACTDGYGTPGTGSGFSSGRSGAAPLREGEGPGDGVTTPTAPGPAPAPVDDGCGDGCGDDSAMGSGGDAVFLTLADLQDLGLV